MSTKKECIFCVIANGDCDHTELIFENSTLVAFKDIRPASDFHYLVVSKVHIENAKSLKLSDKDLILEMKEVLEQLLEKTGVDMNDISLGFHWPPFNSIRHLHMHGIAPASKMSFLSKLIFKPRNFWFCTPQYVIDQLKN